MKFEVVGSIVNVEVVAAGPGVRVRSYLRKAYGDARWRKMKGIATVRFPNGLARSGVALVRSAWNRQKGSENQAVLERMTKAQIKPFVLCIDNKDYQASLIRGKVYRTLPDPRAAKDDFVRIVDESGEDYLYHKSYFVFVDFPPAVTKKLLALEGVA